MTLQLKQEIANAYIEQKNKDKEESGFFDFLKFDKIFDLKDDEIKNYLLGKDGTSKMKLDDMISGKFNLLDSVFSNLKMNVVSMFDGELKQLKEFMDNNTENTNILKKFKEQIVAGVAIEQAVGNALNPSYTSLKSNIDFVCNSADTKLLYNELTGEKPSLESFSYAIEGYKKLPNLGNKKYLTVVDYSLPKTKDRMYIINMETKTIEHKVPVGHGKKSGGNFANSFSDKIGSNQTSLGFYRTPSKVTKANTKDRSGLLLTGIEDSNDNSKNRGIYIHPGSVDGSEGCFTLPKDSEAIMEKLKGDSLLFAYYPDQNYIASSEVLNSSDVRYA